MARSKRQGFLVLPLLLALGAVGYLVLGEGGLGGPRAEGEADGPDETDGAPSALAAGTDGTLAAGAGTSGPRKVVAATEEPEGPSQPTFPKSEGVYGRILDAKERPLPNAKVTLFRVDPLNPWTQITEGAPLGTAVSGTDGRYLVGPAPAGDRLRLRAEATGYGARTEFVSARGTCLDVILEEGGSLVAKVKDEAGVAVAGAKVSGQSGPSWASAVTAPDGTARLESLSIGQVQVRVEAEGYAPATTGDVTIAAGGTVEKAFVLRKGQEITGRVLEEIGSRAVGGATVVSQWWGSMGQQESPPVTTDADGKFTMRVPCGPGEYVQLFARKEGVGTGMGGVQIQAANSGMARGAGRETELRLRAGSDIEGVVVESDGKPAAGATVVYANSIGNKSWAQLSATTDAEGRFSLPTPPGMAKESQYQLGARGKGAGIGFAVVLGNKPGVRIRLAGGGIVMGTVKDGKGQPVEGALVSVQYDWSRRSAPVPGLEGNPWQYGQLMNDPRLSSPFSTSDAEGRYRVEDVPLGNYQVAATWGLDKAVGGQPLQIRAGATETVDLTFGAGKRIEGVVLDAEGKPVAGASVSGGEAQPKPGRNTYVEDRTDTDGRFVLRNLEAERWNVNVYAVGFTAESRPSVAVGERSLELRLTPLGWVDGLVVLPEGGPFTSNFELAAEPIGDVAGGQEDGSRNGREFRQESFSSADGTFRLKGLGAGTWKLSVQSTDNWIPRAPVEVPVVNGRGSGPVEIRLTRGGTVSGLFTEEGSRQSVQWGNIGLQIQGTPDSGGNTSGWGQSDANGRFQITGLATGTYLLTATTPQGMQVEDEVRVVAGQTADLNLAARRFGSVVVKVLDPAGAPVAGASVLLVTSRGNHLNPNWDLLRKEGRVDFTKPDVWQSLSTTDETGVNRRWHVPPGRIEVKVVARGKPGQPAQTLTQGAQAFVDVASDQESTITVTLQAPGGAGGGGDGG